MFLCNPFAVITVEENVPGSIVDENLSPAASSAPSTVLACFLLSSSAKTESPPSAIYKTTGKSCVLIHQHPVLPKKEIGTLTETRPETLSYFRSGLLVSPDPVPAAAKPVPTRRPQQAPCILQGATAPKKDLSPQANKPLTHSLASNPSFGKAVDCCVPNPQMEEPC